MTQEQLVEGLPEFEAISASNWANLLKSSRRASLRSQGVITYAWRLGCIIQAEMEEGVSLADAASPAAQDADVSGTLVEQFAIDDAIRILLAHWVHGEELRLWRNGQLGWPDHPGLISSLVMSTN